MKRFLTVFLAVIVALGATFALTACGNEQGEGRTYTITYELNGGINDPANPETYTMESDTITLRAPTKEGYIFLGWREKGGETVTEIKKGSVGNKTFVAEWEADAEKVYTITYELDGGTNDHKNPANYTIATDTITLRPADKEGYSFMGWKNEKGERVTEIKKGSVGNIVLTAEWMLSEEEVYTIVYELGDGVNDPANPANYTENTETITLRPATKEGCLFVRWENENGDTVTEIRKGSTGNIVLKACWKMVSVTLKFDLENTLRRETHKSDKSDKLEVRFLPYTSEFYGYERLAVGGKTSVPDVVVKLGEAPGNKLPEMDKISDRGDYAIFGWVYKTGDTYALLKAADLIDEEKMGVTDGVLTLYGCVKSAWIGPY